MARSSSGLPYLIRRPDTGKFTYWRELTADLVPHVRGELMVSWTSRGQRVFDGTARVIKVSLATGDEATAQFRWSQVHGHVEALVQLARVLMHEQADRERSRGTAGRLPQEAITTIAGQARHDMLADHDRTWIDPTFTSPLTGVVFGLMRKAGVADTAQSIIEAQRFGEGVLLREAKRNLGKCDPAMLDAAIKETECDFDPALFDLKALRRDDAADLTEAQFRHLKEAKPVGCLPGEVEARLAENGFGLPDDVGRRAVALALLRSRVKVLEDIKARNAGHAIDTPARPATIVPATVAAAPCKPALSTMLAYWIGDRRPGEKEIGDMSLYLRYFTDLFGDRPLDQITPPQLSTFLTQLERCPRNGPHALRQAKLQDRVAWAAKPENADKAKLKRRTINNKGLGSMSALMEQARKLGHVTMNPCDGMALTIRPDDVVKRLPYSLDDLKRMLNAGVYVHLVRDGSFILRGADQWLPLLGLFAGARLEELGQLLVGDIKFIDGIACLIITDIPDEGNKVSAEDAKSVKTVASRRAVPIHATLLRCGFLNFVNEQKARGAVRLFPELPRYRGRVTKEWSKAWGRFTDAHVTNSPTKTFHSFRHLFIATLRKLRTDSNIIKALVGHAIKDVTVNYGVEEGSPFSIEILNEALQKITFEGLDLERFYPDEAAA